MAVGGGAGGTLPVDLEGAPALGVVVLLDLPAAAEGQLGDAEGEAGLEHEGAAASADEGGREIGGARALVAGRVGPVAAHGVVEAGAAGLEAAAAAALGVVLAPDEAHELGHVVAVVPRRAEGVGGDEPARREDDEVGDGRARALRRRRQHREDRRVRVVVRDAADRVEAPEVVLVRVVVPVPGHDVERRVRLPRPEEPVVELGRDRVLGRPVRRRGAEVPVAEAGHGRLEVPHVGEPVGPDRPELRQREVALVELERVAPGPARRQVHLVPDAAREDADLHRPHEEPAELCPDV